MTLASLAAAQQPPPRCSMNTVEGNPLKRPNPCPQRHHRWGRAGIDRLGEAITRRRKQSLQKVRSHDQRGTLATMPAMTAAAAKVPVQVEGHHYDVLIRPGLLEEVGAIVAGLTGVAKAAIVTDSNVGPLLAGSLVRSLAASGIEAIVATLPAGEEHKTLADLSVVFDLLLEHRIERSTPVLALGGGVVGDMAGFVAATILRGVPFIQVPTTLLAMVDASVGGKTGINHSAGKNLIGAFHQPRAVLIDPQVLISLPPHELRSGLAECIKHDIIRDAVGFAELEQSISRAMAVDIEFLSRLIAHNVAIKAQLFRQTHLKRGNVHISTLAILLVMPSKPSRVTATHTASASRLGMVAASRVAQALGMLDQASCLRIVRLIESAGLPVSGLSLPLDKVVQAMLFDKKVKGGRVRFILPDRIGNVVIRDDVPPMAIERAVESLRG